jgi:hypothetical protein
MAGLRTGVTPELAANVDLTGHEDYRRNHYAGDTAVWSDLFKSFGRAKVEPARSLENVTGYCAKYLLKQQDSVADYYEVFGTRRQWEAGKL